jgi:hypothetical protein
VYAGIDQIVLRDEYAASAVCDLLDVNRSGFYAWRSTQETHRAERDRELLPVIQGNILASSGALGSQKDCGGVVEPGDRLRCRVRGPAHEKTRFRAIQPQSDQPRTTESRHRLGYNPNLLRGTGSAGGAQRRGGGRHHVHSAGDPDVARPVRVLGAVHGSVFAEDCGLGVR